MGWKRLYDMWQSDRNNLPLTVDLIDELLASQQLSECEKVFSMVADELRNSPEVRAKYIELLLRQNQMQQALDKSSELCEQTKNHPVALHYLALSRYLNGDLDGVLSLSENTKLTEQTTILLARAHYHNGALDNAMSLVSAIELPEAVGLSAMLHYDTNEIEKALNCAEKALTISDSQMDALLAKASCLVNLQQVNAAKPFINKAIEVQPKSGRALSVRGQIELFETHVDEAIATFSEAVKYMPDHIGTWHLLAWSHYLKNDWSQAKEAFDQAMNIDRNFADTHGGLAVIAAMQEDMARATELAKKALRLNPGSYSGLYASAIIAEQSNNNHEAEQIIAGIMASSSHIAGKTNRDLITAVIEQRKSLH